MPRRRARPESESGLRFGVGYTPLPPTTTWKWAHTAPGVYACDGFGVSVSLRPYLTVNSLQDALVVASKHAGVAGVTVKRRKVNTHCYKYDCWLKKKVFLYEEEKGEKCWQTYVKVPVTAANPTKTKKRTKLGKEPVSPRKKQRPGIWASQQVIREWPASVKKAVSYSGRDVHTIYCIGNNTTVVLNEGKNLAYSSLGRRTPFGELKGCIVASRKVTSEELNWLSPQQGRSKRNTAQSKQKADHSLPLHLIEELGHTKPMTYWVDPKTISVFGYNQNTALSKADLRWLYSNVTRMDIIRAKGDRAKIPLDSGIRFGVLRTVWYTDPHIRVFANFLSSAECVTILDVAKKFEQSGIIPPSTGTSKSKRNNCRVLDCKHRNSTTATLEIKQSKIDPTLQLALMRLANLLRVELPDGDINFKLETPLVNQYKPGQYFRKHFDIDTGTPNRVWTCVIFLNTPEQDSGTTKFPLIGCDIKPKEGSLLVFQNKPDHNPNHNVSWFPESEHSSSKVKGETTKYSLTTWALPTCNKTVAWKYPNEAQRVQSAKRSNSAVKECARSCFCKEYHH